MQLCCCLVAPQQMAREGSHAHLLAASCSLRARERPVAELCICVACKRVKCCKLPIRLAELVHCGTLMMKPSMHARIAADIEGLCQLISCCHVLQSRCMLAPLPTVGSQTACETLQRPSNLHWRPAYCLSDQQERRLRQSPLDEPIWHHPAGSQQELQASSKQLGCKLPRRRGWKASATHGMGTGPGAMGSLGSVTCRRAGA